MKTISTKEQETKPNNRKEDMKNTEKKLYSVWKSMRYRCSKKNHPRFESYGGRGISVCQEWNMSFKDFESWAHENGYLPGLTIERKDNDGNYEPGNCKWATYVEQNLNRRKKKNTESRFRGVSKARTHGKWIAQITRDKKNKHLGTFDTEEDARDAYKQEKDQT